MREEQESIEAVKQARVKTPPTWHLLSYFRFFSQSAFFPIKAIQVAFSFQRALKGGVGS